MPQTLRHRFHERLQEYWNDLRGSRPFPEETEIDPDDLAEMWPSCFLISLDDVTRRHGYRYSYLGSDLIEAYGESANNPDTVLRLVSSSGGKMTEKLDEVVKEEKPVIDEAEFINSKRLHIRYRTCLLPLGPRPGEVSHIIGCMRWKAY